MYDSPDLDTAFFDVLELASGKEKKPGADK